MISARWAYFIAAVIVFSVTGVMLAAVLLLGPVS